MQGLRLFSLLLVLLSASAMALEEPQYDVLDQSSGYEVRRYLSYVVAEVDVAGNGADNRAFRMLAGYIFGDNNDGEKMNMTAPVESRGEPDAMTYAFVMERRYTMATLPEPNDERIRLLKRPERVVAVRRFSGRWSDSNVQKNEAALLEDLAENGVRTLGPVELARYNSPFTPWFMRRNEVMVPVDWPDSAR